MVKRLCSICGKPAIVHVPYARMSFCKEHFIQFYERRILKAIRSAKLLGARILVALSGGKDSVALLAAMQSISGSVGFEVEALHIDLGIPEYSKLSRKVSEEVASKLGVRLHVVDAKEVLGFTVPEATVASRRPPCAICGSIKRWIINAFAYENGFDYAATGHNMDDVSTFYLKALLTNRPEDVLKGQPTVTPPRKELKLVGRLRPQLFLREVDNLTYVMARGLPFVDVPCPLAQGATTLKYKALWEEILRVNPGGQINLIKSLNTIASLARREETLYPCRVCGYPTASPDRLCFVCRLRTRIAGARDGLRDNP